MKVTRHALVVCGWIARYALRSVAFHGAVRAAGMLGDFIQ